MLEFILKAALVLLLLFFVLTWVLPTLLTWFVYLAVFVAALFVLVKILEFFNG